MASNEREQEQEQEQEQSKIEYKMTDEETAINSEEEKKDSNEVNGSNSGDPIQVPNVPTPNVPMRRGQSGIASAQGESELERMANRIFLRRQNRIPVAFDIRVKFLKTCRLVAEQHGLRNKIRLEHLIELRDAQKEKVKENVWSPGKKAFMDVFGIWDVEGTMLELFETGVQAVNHRGGQWFFFRDFSFYNTVVVEKFFIMRNPVVSSFLLLFFFYIGTAIFFCHIVKDGGVCPSEDGHPTRGGYLTAVYFASVTMSTVGYGDVSVSKDDPWRVFVGIIYMLLALLIGFTVFVTAAEYALSGVNVSSLGDAITKVYDRFFQGFDPNVALWKQIRRIKVLRITELLTFLVIVNIAAAIMVRLLFRAVDDEWDWMTTLYWAVQTTTTIGYGDLNMPFDIRWAQVFFTALAPVLVGGVFGSFANLSQELQDLRRYYAWKRREVSKRLIEDLKGQASEGDTIDEYEFMVGSLLMLNKIEENDITNIMEKFRELAGDKGYISFSQAQTQAENVVTNTTPTEEQTGNLSDYEEVEFAIDIDDTGALS